MWAFTPQEDPNKEFWRQIREQQKIYLNVAKTTKTFVIREVAKEILKLDMPEKYHKEISKILDKIENNANK